MPDKDDKNSGKTSLPGQFQRDKQEVEGIKDGHHPSFKGVNDREAEAPRNHDQPDADEQAAKNVPASKQG
ncbi:MAG: hypothetical protein ACR2J4_07055 [Deinococcus sp.]